jgi:hypothetical protein
MERIQTNDLVSYLADRYPVEKDKYRKEDREEKINSSSKTLREYYGGNTQNTQTKNTSYANLLMWIIIAVIVIFILLMSCKK